VTGDVIQRAANDLFSESKLETPMYSGATTKDFKMSNFPKMLRERVFKYFSDPVIGCLDKKPIDGVWYFLKYLETRGHQIGIVTSRPIQLHKATRYIIWRDFNDINFELGVWFSNKEDSCNLEKAPTKMDILTRLQPDIYFDDYYPYCQQAKIAHGSCMPFLICNKHTGWNHEIELPHSIGKVKSVMHIDRNLYGI
jgi:FMN phosphatase YigB (HAD superfamily)